MSRCWIAAVLFALTVPAGCAGPGAGPSEPPPAPAVEESFIARGQEPGWLLTIDAERMTLKWNYGADEISAPRPPATQTASGRRYLARADEGRRLRVDIASGVCRDVMSGMPYPHRVTVAVDDEMLRGCGGEPESLLVGPEWVVEDIGGRGIIDNSRVTLQFDAGGALTGRAGCNTYGASWRLSGEGLTVTAPRATRKSCAPALDRQELDFLRLLAQTSGFDIGRDGALIIHTAGGADIVARREQG